MAGLTPEGLVVKTLTEIVDEVGDDCKEQFGNSVNLEDTSSILARYNAIVASFVSEVWEAIEAAYNAQDPDANTGAAQDAICAITGTERNPAAPSTVTLTLTGADATLVPSKSFVSVLGTGEIFETAADATLSTAAIWAATTPYALDDRVSNNDPGDEKIYLCVTAGTSGGSTPTGEGDAIADGTVVWRYLGDGVAYVDVESESGTYGPIVAASGDLTVIESPVSGWDSAINILDADLGQYQESDEDLRIRREEELQRPGTSPQNAIRADLLDLDGVETVTVFVNNGDDTDADGIPPHAVEAMVSGGDDQDIWDQLWDSVAAGIATHGGEVGTVTDSEGTDQTVKFTRPTEIDIWVDITLEYDVNLWPADGDDQIKAAIVAWGDAQVHGKDVVSSAIKAACFGVNGVLDVSLAYIGTAPAPVSEATIAISTRQIAIYDTSRVTVSSSPGTP